MIIKSYEIKNFKSDRKKQNSFLLYGENVGLKKDIRNFIISNYLGKEHNEEIVSFYENEIIQNDEILYNLIYSGSLFSSQKVITVYDATDKIIKNVEDIHEKYPDNIVLIFVSDILEKRSKLRSFFEKEEKTICVPCYLDNSKDLEIILNNELRKINLTISKESRNLLIEKSNSDRNNLRNEIKKIESYALNKKKVDIEEIRSLINFSGDYKSDTLINECLCGNILQFKKIVSEFYVNTINQIYLLRMLNNKIHRLLNIKAQENSSSNLDALINSSKPPIFWKDKPVVKQQLKIWNLDNLNKMINDINNTELLCKKNPQISNSIFLNFFSEICKKAKSYS